MYVLRTYWHKLDFIYLTLALVSLVSFNGSLSTSVFQTLKDQTIFMTTIHQVLLDPFFLIGGGYIGLYAVYLLISQIHHYIKAH